jgi:hypothetical protein
VVNTFTNTTKQAITSHLHSMKIDKNTTYDFGNPGPGLGRAQQCGRAKPVNVIPTFPWGSLYSDCWPHYQPKKMDVTFLSGSESVQVFLLFVKLFIYVLLLEIQLSRGESWDHINRFSPATLLCPSQARTWISKVICGLCMVDVKILFWRDL